MKNQKYDKLYRHPLYLLISKDINEIAKLTIDNKDEGRTIVNSRQYFVTKIMYPFFEISDKLKSLHISISLIKNYSISKELREFITREEYITYHLEYYFISQIALFDRVLHLCNITYDLGLSDRYVTYDVVKNNSNVSNECKTALKVFNDYLEKKEIRKTQNKIKHKEKLIDKEMYRAALFEVVSRDLAGENTKDLKEASLLYYKEYLKVKKGEMTVEIKELEGFVINVFNALYPNIEREYRNIKL